MNETEKSKELWNQIEKVTPGQRRSVFIEYCVENIRSADDKEISKREAAYNICGGCNKFFDDLMPEFSNLMDLACDLELPKDTVEENPGDWDKMVSIITAKM